MTERGGSRCSFAFEASYILYFAASEPISNFS
jgi:hypothetical protein